jgi:lactate permease
MEITQKWIQNYDPLGPLAPGMPAYLPSALAATVPLFLLFYLLAVKRAPGHRAAGAALAAALALAVTVWGMPPSAGVAATLMGAAFGLLPIVWIVITAVWVYRQTVESGAFEIIKDSLAGLTGDRRLQAIFIAFAFGAFIEGTAGFGTPVAITAAMLTGLGFNPLYAAGICLIANTAPVAFGAIGVPVVTAASASGLDLNRISAVIGRQLPFLSLIVPFWMCCAMCGFRKTLEVLPAVLVSGMCFAVSQFAFSNFHGPYLPDIMSALITLAGMIALLRVWKPKSVWHFPGERASPPAVRTHAARRVLRAWSPYAILAVTVFVWGIDSFKNLGFVRACELRAAWPWLHGVVVKTAPLVPAAADYAAVYAINPLSTAGTAIFLTGLVSSLIMPDYGIGKALACLGRTIGQLKFPILTIAAVLGLAYVMNYSGMSSTLGLAFTRTGALFPLFAPLLGWLGVFLTGSDTSSNALFSSLQRTTAEAVGIDPHLTVAANSSGGVTGKMISPQSISVATAAARMVGQEGKLFRFTLFHSLAMTAVVCLITLLQAYWLRWMLP